MKRRECEQLHETVVRDVVDILTSAKDVNDIEWFYKPSSGSIAKRASNLTLVFPVIVSSSMSINSAILISKAIERKCVSLLQILFSSVQVNEIDDLEDYVSKFHKNLSLKQKMDLGEFMDIMRDLDESGTITVTDRDAYEAVREDMQNINNVLSTEFNPVSINDYKLVPNVYGESSIVLDKVEPIKESDLKDSTDYHRYQLVPSDVKKANELVPTTMLVSFTTSSSGCKNRTTGVIGVKAKLYPVDQMELINRIVSKTKERNGLFNLIRATTREISFFKDLAFAIDKAKLDGVYMGKDDNNSRMFKVLERRSSKNKYMKLLKSNDASPITSLVLSQDDVEYLKKYNNIDMEKSFNARTILESYNLMDLVIVDESLEIAKFMFDTGDGVYETLTFDSLEKESNNNDYKKVINLMSKINR